MAVSSLLVILLNSTLAFGTVAKDSGTKQKTHLPWELPAVGREFLG
jgi:hypothetical protein